MVSKHHPRVRAGHPQVNRHAQPPPRRHQAVAVRVQGQRLCQAHPRPAYLLSLPMAHGAQPHLRRGHSQDQVAAARREHQRQVLLILQSLRVETEAPRLIQHHLHHERHPCHRCGLFLCRVLIVAHQLLPLLQRLLPLPRQPWLLLRRKLMTATAVTATTTSLTLMARHQHTRGISLPLDYGWGGAVMASLK